ncbi:MAG: LemA family protein [Clostridia bacterium]|nr:LemA family protein [Clostridia bacterium]
MPIWGIVLIVLGMLIVLAAVCIVAWVIKVYNALVKLRNNVKEGYSTMDVYMKKRYDLVPNLVETVKGVAKHENETLENVMQARYSCMSATTPKEKAANENMLTDTLQKLFAVTENYPELKANANFTQLQNELSSIEGEIVNARKYYNGCVKIFNNKIEVFPSNLVARKFKFEQADLFEIEDKEERKTPQVKF